MKVVSEEHPLVIHPGQETGIEIPDKYRNMIQDAVEQEKIIWTKQMNLDPPSPNLERLKITVMADALELFEIILDWSIVPAPWYWKLWHRFKRFFTSGSKNASIPDL